MFEIWEIVYDGYEMRPMFLNSEFKNFFDAYSEFKKLLKVKPCCIIYNKEKK